MSIGWMMDVDASSYHRCEGFEWLYCDFSVLCSVRLYNTCQNMNFTDKSFFKFTLHFFFIFVESADMYM